MKAKRLRWLGSSRRASLYALLQSQCVGVLSSWSTEAKLDEVKGAPKGRERSFSYAPGWYSSHGSAGSCFIQASDTQLSRLGCHLSRTKEPDKHGIALRIAKRLLMELGGALTDTANPDLTALPGMPSGTDIEDKYGAAGFVLRIGGAQLEIYLNAKLIDSLMPLAQPPSVPLTSRSLAVLPVQASLSATLDLGRTPVSTAAGLRNGEVLKTTIPITTRINVQGVSGSIAFVGELARSDGRRAIRVTHSKSTRV